jgi:REP element-mobilizing transposase RayT
MARPLRIDVAGGWYHVSARGIKRRAIFREDRERLYFLELIEEAVSRFGVQLHAYVLMDNHYHLVVETPAANLSTAMQWINVSYSVWFNRRRGRAGHVFQGRFTAVVAEPWASGAELSRYVHVNPVRVKRLGLDKSAQARARAGMGTATRDLARERMRRLRGYRWSSYRAYVGLTKRPEWLVTERVLALCGGGSGAKARERYREFVEAAVRERLAASPWERLEAGLMLGGKKFVARMKRLAKGNPRQQPALRAIQRRGNLKEVVRYVEQLKGEAWLTFRDQHGDWGRDMVLWLGRKVCGAKLRALAELAGVTAEATVTVAVKRLDERLRREAGLRKMMETARTELLNVTDGKKLKL